ITPTGTPPAPRYFQTGVWDATRRRMLVFGGYDGGSYRNDLWALTLNDPPEWSAVSTTGTPPPARAKHTAVIDASRDRMIVFGGETTGGVANNDAWEVNLSTLAWNQVSTSGAPPPERSWHSAIYDAQGDRMVVYGGTGPSAGHLGDLWALGGNGVWSPIAATGTTLSRYAHSAVLDPQTREMLVWGGDLATQQSYPDDSVHVLSLGGSPAWQSRPPQGQVPFSYMRFHTVSYDPIHRAMLQVGGGTVFGLAPSNYPAFQLSLPQLVGVPSPPSHTISRLQLAVGPQPSHGETRISFDLPSAATVRIALIDLAGRNIARVDEAARAAGHHELVWSGAAAGGSHVGPGMYWVRLSTATDAVTRKLVIVE
ncbi:MAG: kelch repeat-containing protein, partial [Candidatus Eisenbacteria bacterium]